MRTLGATLLVAGVLAASAAAQTPRPAATIAAEKDDVDKKIGLQSNATPPTAPTAPAGRPIPGEMGRPMVSANPDPDAPISLLGVTMAKSNISRDFVRLRDEVGAVKQSLQPKIEAQKELKERYRKENSQLDNQIAALEKQRSQSLDQEKSEDRKEAIRRTFQNQIDAVIEKQDELQKKINEADAEIGKIWNDPKLVAAERELNNQIVRDSRKYFPQNP